MSTAQEDPVFSSDVLYLKNLIGRTVSVKTVDNHSRVGVVYVVDPAYKTVVLVNSATNCLEFVLHHAIKSFDILPDARNENFLHQNIKNTFSSEDLVHKRQSLVKWLKQMFVDVKEDGEMLLVEEHLIIGPPYGKSDCMCDNTIVLERIQTIIDTMPPDFK